MNLVFKKSLAPILFLTLVQQLLFAQVSPPKATGTYSLSNGNELRLLQILPDVFVSGNLINAKKKVMAQFTGNYDPTTGRLDGIIFHCAGFEEELLWYFSRNKSDKAEVYLGPAGKDTKVVASRIHGNPQLEFPCKTSRRKVKKMIRRGNKLQSNEGSYRIFVKQGY